MNNKPRIRPVEAFPVEFQGDRFICLSDPQNVAEQTMLINDLGFFFVSRMDGSKSVLDMQSEFSQKYGDIIPSQQIEDLIERLDLQYFLDNERARQRLDILKMEYASSRTRPCTHAGLSYPENPAEINSMLDSFYRGISSLNSTKTIRGIMAPHIDIRHGGPSFASAYVRLKKRRPDLFVILGTGHAGSSNIFTAVSRDFETPLGIVKTDHSALGKLQESFGESITDEEFLHRNEHSIEFQIVFLQHLFAPDPPPPVLAIMCTSFYQFVQAKKEPAQTGHVAKFISSLKRAVEGKDVCYIAGVDLAHVGLKFGGEKAPDANDLMQIEKQDRKMLDYACKMNASGFFNSVVSDGDARNICGFPAMYIFLKMCESEAGELLRYDQMVDKKSGSVVSYASLAFE